MAIGRSQFLLGLMSFKGDWRLRGSMSQNYLPLENKPEERKITGKEAELGPEAMNYKID